MSARIKLTKLRVEAIVAADKEIFVWDAHLGGFGVRVKPSGARSYLIQYRNRHGQTRRLTLGRHGVITCEQARQQAVQLLASVRAGADPSRDRRAKRKAPTLNGLLDAFVSDHVDMKLKPTTAREYRGMIDRLIRPALGKQPIEAIAHRDVTRLHRGMKSTPRQANHAVAVLSKAFTWGARHGFPMSAEGNPAQGVERFKENARDRFLSGDELARLGAVLAEAERQAVEMPSVVAALRLLIFTGCRLSEVLTLKWQHVDLENSCLRLPDSKTGKKIVYLNAPALELLASIERTEGNPFAFPGRKVGAYLVNINKPWRRIRASAGLDDVRLHDLRHSFASVAAGAGFGLPIIGKLLGHGQAATTARYAHLGADPIRQASDAIGRRLVDAMSNSDRVGDKSRVRRMAD